MVVSDTWNVIDGFTIALVTSEFGQVWAEDENAYHSTQNVMHAEHEIGTKSR